eukprot:CAMPEP_0119405558 /NCGR_PEP_ID=MMETSP1335-20130426/107_1 /TAXON_ID=259385 /ORGANISM="Chrysoculter rhomboideus, Strain RCC1486" /LENGTH=113 /DNA_ID=CAMNT_0007429553 /DNA_START=511 /DNA_END=852 /DNA_ORIENTATION=-
MASSRALAADTPRELNITGHDRHTLGMNRAEVRVCENPDEVRLGSLLQREERRRLEAHINDAEVSSNLAHESLKRQLADEQRRRLLVFANLSECDRSWAVAGRRHPGARPGHS